jgi:DNA invertase Pin-like site-specific DNA recombinase
MLMRAKNRNHPSVIIDTIGKNRNPDYSKNSGQGESHARAKLTEKQVVNIRRGFKLGSDSYKEYAKQYNITGAHLSRIIRRVDWKHI